jgi:citrate lyase beta subunit
MTPGERALRIKLARQIVDVIEKAENEGANPEFINGMKLAAAIVEERRRSNR